METWTEFVTYLLIVCANGIFWNPDELLMRMKVEDNSFLESELLLKYFRNCYGSEDIFLTPHTSPFLLSFYYQIVILGRQDGTSQKRVLQFADYISEKFHQISISNFEHKRKCGGIHVLFGFRSWFTSYCFKRLQNLLWIFLLKRVKTFVS